MCHLTYSCFVNRVLRRFDRAADLFGNLLRNVRKTQPLLNSVYRFAEARPRLFDLGPDLLGLLRSIIFCRHFQIPVLVGVGRNSTVRKFLNIRVPAGQPRFRGTGRGYVTWSFSHFASSLIDSTVSRGTGSALRSSASAELMSMNATTPTIAATTSADAQSGMKFPRIITTDRKSTRLNSSHLVISYAVFCLK